MRNMLRGALIAALIASLLMLTGCGMILVEDSGTVRIGMQAGENINRNMLKKT